MEEVAVRQQHLQVEDLPPLQDFVSSYQFVGVPQSAPLTSSTRLLELLAAPRVWETANKRTEFGLGVHVCAYPGGMMAVWLFLAAITPLA